MATDTTVSNLVINKLTQEEYDGIAQRSDTELYLVPDTGRELPAVSSSNNGSILMVVDGVWRAQDINLQMYYTGTEEPASTLGNDGDIYLQQSE